MPGNFYRVHRRRGLHAGDAPPRRPTLHAGFRTPLAWPVAIVAILGCLYLFYSLPQRTQLWFLFAHIFGFALYFLYGARRSVAGPEEA